MKSSGADVATFLDQSLAETGLEWEPDNHARLRAQPDLQELAFALLKSLRAWKDGTRELPRGFESAREAAQAARQGDA
ncbi:MAG: hypothetical protein ACAI25_17085 [Planctomycetota bacterium]